MGTSAGPSLAGIGRVGASNLVLEMDARDAKSYPGEPTANYILHGVDGIPTHWWGDGSNQSIGTKGAVDITDPSLKYNGYPTILWTPGDSENVYLNGSADIDQTALSTVWTFSCYVKAEDSGTLRTSDNSLFVYFYRGSASYPSDSGTGTVTDVGDGWYRVHLSVSGTSNYAGLIGFSTFRAETKFYLSGAQLEKKSYPTPVVTGVLNSGEVYDARPASVNLMIHGNVGTGQTFSDSSPSKHTITANGNTTHSAAQSKFGGGSIYFDGTGDYLRTAAADFLDGSWTVDCWFYYDGSFPGTIEGLIALDYDGASGSSNNALNFGVTSGAMALLVSSNVSSGWNIVNTTGGTVAANAWNHGAVVFDGSTYKAYLNGSQVISVTSSTAVASQSSSQIIVGTTADGSSGQSWNGYIDEVRVTTGTALWLSDFTPPTRRNLSAPVVDRSGNDNGGNFATTETTDVASYRAGEVIEPIASATWDFDGTDDKTSIKTDAFDLKCFTVAIKQGGIHAGPFPQVPGQVNIGMDIGGGGFNGVIMGSWTGTMDDETLSLWGYNSTNPSGDSATYIKGEIQVGWHIFTFNWNGSDYDFWVDGTKRTTYARGGGSGHCGLLSGVTAFYPGWSSGWSTNYFEGNIAFFRAYDKSLSDQQIIENFHAKRNSLNIANWANRDIVQDSLLLWLDAGVPASYSGTGSIWTDLATTGSWTKDGDPVWTGGGNEGYFDFDGTGDGFDLDTHTTTLNPGTGDMTWETWCQIDSTTADKYIYSNFESGNDRIEFRAGSGGKWARMLMNYNGTAWYRDTATAAATGTWVHLVVRYDRGAANMQDGVSFYVNGVADAGTTDGGTWVQNADINPASSVDSIGRRGSSSEDLDGKIAVMRIYNKKLSASEIEQNFTVQRQRFVV